MAPRTLARSRLLTAAGWVHPAWYRGGPFSPVFFADGGEPTGADPESDADPEPGSGDDWTPPTKEEWESSQHKLRTASAEAMTRRKYLKAHGIDPKTGQKADPDPDPADGPDRTARDGQGDEPRGATPAEVKRAIERAAGEAELKGRRQTRALVTGLNASLADAGWNGQRLASLMKLIDIDDVEIDDDGTITGLADQIETIKGEWPEFFKRQRSTPANPAAGSGQNGAGGAKVDTADKPAPRPEPKGWAEQVAARALRGQA